MAAIFETQKRLKRIELNNSKILNREQRFDSTLIGTVKEFCDFRIEMKANGGYYAKCNFGYCYKLPFSYSTRKNLFSWIEINDSLLNGLNGSSDIDGLIGFGACIEALIKRKTIWTDIKWWNGYFSN